MWRGIIDRYKEYLPVTGRTPVVTLNEGNTPLIFSGVLSERLGASVYLKYEGLNPTGYFKDRGMTLAVSKAKEAGAKVVICASTGNTSASAAAYAARAGIRCVVLIPRGAIALGKLSQALIHNARVVAVNGNFDEALQIVRDISRRHNMTLVNSVNPARLEGQKTAAFEICDQLGAFAPSATKASADVAFAPDFVAIPVGNAGNISAYWKGFGEYHCRGKISSKPGMLGFQAEGAAPIVKKKVIFNPKTVATAIRIGNPASWKMAEAARDESGGRIDTVTDREILSAYGLLAKKEGIFVEPASAASVAGILKLNRSNYFGKAKRKKGGDLQLVCILTGHGLKDPDRAIRSVRMPKAVPAKMNAILEAIRR